ncbi:hypothetical protein A5724_19530 [Mycobacterium sp. ACS1612]|uniref:hypothetical protein n=1 Tax=Mycobacterium sp. ACS1612 TaxID=1834117 RepID=UPI0007FFDC91|nr:hypothetical protein [Mycobacterium sp. ACS1612]OBF33262.1 hypothetical protein A5724_19530 [Mycobacterium sp. ACS1612]
MALPTHERRQELLRAHAELLDATDPLTAAATRRGISLQTLRRRIKREEIEYIEVGRDHRIWRDA